MYCVNCYIEYSHDGKVPYEKKEYEYRTFDTFETFEEAKKHAFEEYEMENMIKTEEGRWVEKDWQHGNKHFRFYRYVIVIESAEK